MAGTKVEEDSWKEKDGNLIQRLQWLKTKQLESFKLLPVQSEEDVAKVVEEKICHEKSTNLIDALKALPTQSARLIGKLAFDVADLSCDVSTTSRKDLLSRIQTKYYLHGDNFLLKEIPAHPLLKEWYRELKNINVQGEKLSLPEPKSALLEDKKVFNIKYDPFCTRCRDVIGISGFLEYPLDPSPKAKLGFSSCRKGFCCRVILESTCRLCMLNETAANKEVTTKMADDEVQIKIDPTFRDSLYFTVTELRDIGPALFISSHLWPSIDRIIT